MALVMAGAFVVGVSALSGTDPDQPKASNPALGNMLIVRPCPCPACPRATRLPLRARGAWARLTPQAGRGVGQVSAQLIVATQMVPSCWSALTLPTPHASHPSAASPGARGKVSLALQGRAAPAPASTFARTTPSLPAPKAFPGRARSSPRRPRPSAPAGPERARAAGRSTRCRRSAGKASSDFATSPQVLPPLLPPSRSSETSVYVRGLTAVAGKNLARALLLCQRPPPAPAPGLAAMYFLPFGNDVCDGPPRAERPRAARPCTRRRGRGPAGRRGAWPVTRGRGRGRAGHACVENTPHAIREAATSAPLALAIAGNVLSIAFFNYFGVSVTQSMSATHRMSAPHCPQRRDATHIGRTRESCPVAPPPAGDAPLGADVARVRPLPAGCSTQCGQWSSGPGRSPPSGRRSMRCRPACARTPPPCCAAWVVSPVGCAGSRARRSGRRGGARARAGAGVRGADLWNVALQRDRPAPLPLSGPGPCPRERPRTPPRRRARGSALQPADRCPRRSPSPPPLLLFSLPLTLLYPRRRPLGRSYGIRSCWGPALAARRGARRRAEGGGRQKAICLETRRIRRARGRAARRVGRRESAAGFAHGAGQRAGECPGRGAVARARAFRGEQALWPRA